ncbi:HDOD domain-containing protein [Sulfurospirillum sp. T05]|uniref:HDOD domain-containing protein n=1 Tax=Sulfurospirillum tamanense TaxID=2813362 RepID=A0ABS2WQE4_9BACT|nr:HDOD domain-containing protein [Sulfurospirillum tamanensis]MBN2963800.1 HDOD domain-containing protein [Sulfurospirillum tamanensis]
MDETILKKIKSLPPLDDTILKIQRICTDKNSSLNDLVKVVESDPMLTANILKSSNSPLYGFSREIKNISHAISLFGMATVRGFALSSAIKQSMKINLTPYNITNGRFLEISTYQSALMFNWYTKVDRSLLDILLPASFLMEVGKVVLANVLMDKNTFEPFLAKIKTIRTLEELSVLERETHGITSEEVTAKIFEQWNLEAELGEAIRFSSNASNAPSAIAPLARPLHVVKTTVNVFDQLSLTSTQNATALLDTYGFGLELFNEAAQKVTA